LGDYTKEFDYQTNGNEEKMRILLETDEDRYWYEKIQLGLPVRIPGGTRIEGL